MACRGGGQPSSTGTTQHSMACRGGQLNSTGITRHSLACRGRTTQLNWHHAALNYCLLLNVQTFTPSRHRLPADDRPSPTPAPAPPHPATVDPPASRSPRRSRRASAGCGCAGRSARCRSRRNARGCRAATRRQRTTVTDPATTHPPKAH